MRWGVGKGRFRNLSATILSVFLALSFGVVWTFFQRIEPLTVDTSARSQKASISERLINTSHDDTLALRQSQLVLFCRILDSVNAVFARSFPGTKPHNNKWLSDTLPEKLRQTQVLSRKTIAFMLNQSYTPISHYRRCESAVLSLLAAHEEIEPRYRDIYSSALAKMAMERVSDSLQTITLADSEKELIHELEAQLRNKLGPIRLGLSSDSLDYIELARLSHPKDGAR